MRNGWTGGQYSLVRAAIGTYLAVHYAMLFPWGPELFSNRGVLPDASLSPLSGLFPNLLTWFDAPAVVTAMIGAAIGLALLLALGFHDRPAAIALAYVQACLLGRSPLIANPAIPFVGWILLAHACLPPAPYGSLEGRGRPDPRGGWSFPPPLFLAGWIVLALGYSYGGYTKLVSPSWLDGSALSRVLENPLARPGFLREQLLAIPPVLLQLATWGALGLELLFAPLALARRLRPWIWVGMVGMHLGLLTMIAFADLTTAMLLVHLFTLDPAWVPARAPGATEHVLYDGACGLCHRAVRFILAEDRSGTAFRFAPLQGEHVARLLDPAAIRELPDSVAVVTSRGEILSRSAAVLHVMERLGGLWRVLAILARPIPRQVRDVAYDAVARVRHRLFARPKEACPIVPAELRARFDD